MQDLNSLREKLMETEQWPSVYMYKFIVPNKDGNVERVVEILPKPSDISYKHTKSLSHVSVTCKAVMESADSIIGIYEKMGSINGIISL